MSFVLNMSFGYWPPKKVLCGIILSKKKHLIFLLVQIEKPSEIDT